MSLPRCFVAAKASDDTRNLAKQTPLVLTALHGNIEAVRVMAKAGVRIDLVDEHGDPCAKCHRHHQVPHRQKSFDLCAERFWKVRGGGRIE